MPKKMLTPDQYAELITMIATALAVPLGHYAKFDSEQILAQFPSPKTRSDLHEQITKVIIEQFTVRNKKLEDTMDVLVNLLVDEVKGYILEKKWIPSDSARNHFVKETFQPLIENVVHELCLDNDIFQYFQDMLYLDFRRSDTDRLSIQLLMLDKVLKSTFQDLARNLHRANRKKTDKPNNFLADLQQIVNNIVPSGGVISLLKEQREIIFSANYSDSAIVKLHKAFHRDKFQQLCKKYNIAPGEQALYLQCWNIIILITLLQLIIIKCNTDSYDKVNPYFTRSLSINWRWCIPIFIISFVLFRLLVSAFSAGLLSIFLLALPNILNLAINATGTTLIAVYEFLGWKHPADPTQQLLILLPKSTLPVYQAALAQYEGQYARWCDAQDHRSQQAARRLNQVVAARTELLDNAPAVPGYMTAIMPQQRPISRIIRAKGMPALPKADFPNFTSEGLDLELQFHCLKKEVSLPLTIQVNTHSQSARYLVHDLCDSKTKTSINSRFGVFSNANILRQGAIPQFSHVKLSVYFLVLLLDEASQIPNNLITTLEGILAMGNFTSNSHSQGNCITNIAETDTTLQPYYQQDYRYKLHYKDKSRVLGKVVPCTFISKSVIHFDDKYIRDCKLIVFDKYVDQAHRK